VVFYYKIVDMNTRNLKCFQTVYEEHNLQTAANKLFLSPQGLSKIIKGLEDECGSLLFVRTKDGLIPTESGKVFYEKSQKIIKDINEMLLSIEVVDNKEKRFRVGFAAGTIRVIDIARVNRFMNDNPEIVTSWSEYENKKILKQVLNDEISFGFVVGKPGDASLTSQLIEAIDVVLYVYKGHRLWNSPQIEIQDIKDESVISMNENYRIYQDINNICQVNGFLPEIVAKVSEGRSIYRLVKNGIGIGICPRFFEDNEEIRAIPIKDAYKWEIYGVYKTDSADRDLARKFIDSLTIQ
jgi:DNA-binding transcriptional LysR family regulator